MRTTDLQAVLDLLPAPVSEIEQLGGMGRPWSVRYGARRAVLRRNDPGRFRSFSWSEEMALASIAWLHHVLRDLAQLGFVAPVPISDLGDRSIAMVEGAVWELLSHVPGRPMGWTDNEMHRAGALLARFHQSSLALPSRPQRPGSQSVGECRARHPEARALQAAFEWELEDIGHKGAIRAVVHGDATQSNVVIDDSGDYHLVDFAIAYQDVLLADVASALWRNGRESPNAVVYDAERAARFVHGYATVRPLVPSAARAIVVYMKGRGLQLEMRLELRKGNDETVIQRLLSIEAQQVELEAAITAALDDPRHR